MLKSSFIYHVLGYTLSFLLGCLLCNYLFIYFNISMVLGSSLIGLLGTFIFYKNKEIQAAIYCGSFSGMTDPRLFESWIDLVIISVSGGVILYFLRKRLIGVGGKLGAVAFSSFLSLMLYRELF